MFEPNGNWVVWIIDERLVEAEAPEVCEAMDLYFVLSVDPAPRGCQVSLSEISIDLLAGAF